MQPNIPVKLRYFLLQKEAVRGNLNMLKSLELDNRL